MKVEIKNLSIGFPTPTGMSLAVRGVSMTTIDLTGAYVATGGQVKEGQGPQAGYRMLAAVAEGAGGNIFIRFIGPEKTVAAGMAKYEQLLTSLQRE